MTGEFSTLHPFTDVDPTVVHRARTRALRRDDSSTCSRILLYLPDFASNNGHGHQIHSYIKAALLATFEDRAMVVLDSPQDSNRWDGGSQFGCPPDAFVDEDNAIFVAGHGNNDALAISALKDDFPRGLSRLLDHPDWLSRNCSIPCVNITHQDWYRHARSGNWKVPILCDDDNKNGDGDSNDNVNVLVVGGAALIRRFYNGLQKQMEKRPLLSTTNNTSDVTIARNWSLTFGISSAEADYFTYNLTSSRQVRDHVSSWIVRTGLVRLQPWMARDVAVMVQRIGLLRGYDAIHVRRGDKLLHDARGDVVAYWKSRGYDDEDALPTNYVPFSVYLQKLYETNDGGDDYNDNGNSTRRQRQQRNIYVATVDRQTVEAEIANDTSKEFTNYDTRYIFYPSQSHSLHLNTIQSCRRRYARNVATVVDLVVLTRADTFVGEYNSNMGRLVRTLRTTATSTTMQGGVRIETRDVRVAWGRDVPMPPGF